MGLLKALAWRNIWRNKRRTLLTVSAIALCVTVLIFFSAIQISSYSTSINANVSILEGFAQIQVEGYRDRPEIRKSFPLIPSSIEELRVKPAVKSASARAMSFALFSTEDRSYGAQVMGVMPRYEPEVSTIPSLMIKGRYLDSSKVNEVVVGAGLARNLKAEVGSEITLLGQGRDGSVAAGILQVVGVFESGSVDLDRALAQVSLESFQELFAMDGDVHAIVVRGEDVDHIQPLMRTLHGFVKNRFSQDETLRILSWEDLLPGIKQAIELDMAAGWIFFSSLVVVVSFLILNTFLMSILERTREFGVLLAVGLRPFWLAGFVFLECLFILAIGLAAGVVVGSLVVKYFQVVGFSIPGTEEILKVWHLPSAIHPYLTPFTLLAGPAVMAVATLIAVLYPLVRILRLEPVSAMRSPT